MPTSAEPYIYADNAATTPLSPAVLDAMMPYLTNAFGNPSGIHRVAREAAEALADARARIAGLLDASSPDEIYFTSGGSESDTWILQGAARRFRDSYGAEAPVRIVTSAIEHHAVLHACEALERAGVEITVLPVDDEGFVSPDDLACVLAQLQASTGADEHVGAAAGRAHSMGVVGNHDRPDAGASLPPAALVSIMLANNEVGSIQNIEELARIAHEFGVPFHTDAVQAVGHIPVSIKALGVDALSLSAHKFHGPRGTGALYLKDGLSIPPLIAGGAQERGLRAGTENLAGAVGLAAALQENCEGLAEHVARIGALRDAFTDGVLASCENVLPTGPRGGARRLPSIASFICRDVDSELLVMLLDRAGVAAAAGSACSTGSTAPSHVISALGVNDPAWAHGSVRFSLADDVTEADIELLLERVPACIRRARAISCMR